MINKEWHLKHRMPKNASFDVSEIALDVHCGLQSVERVSNF